MTDDARVSAYRTDTERLNLNELNLDDLQASDLRAGRPPYLLVLRGQLAGQAFKLTREETVVGRSAEADIVLTDAGVSRKHVKLVRRDGKMWLIDQGSTNGTYLAGGPVKPHEEHPLQAGDKIGLGTLALLKFGYLDTLEEQLQNQLFEGATRDGLTGALNRRYFTERLRQDFALATRHHLPLTAILMDVDHFKQVNDTCGHPAGDAVLTQLVRLLQPRLGPDDLLARIGGEEFVLLLRGRGLEDGELMAESLRKLVETTPFMAPIGGGTDAELHVTISMGLATYIADNYVSEDALMQAADAALQHAKKEGRNRVHILRDDLASQVYSSATRDRLTGVYNRKAFAERLVQDLAYARRHRDHIGLLLIDIDRFEQVNETHGIGAGDAVLEKLSQMLQSVIRSEDVLARYGGDEFVLLIRGTDAKGAQLLAERIRVLVNDATFTRPTPQGSLEGKVTVSIGLAVYEQGRCPSDSVLLDVAADALAKAKASGRNQVGVSLG